jgi:hypothetical protein
MMMMMKLIQPPLFSTHPHEKAGAIHLQYSTLLCPPVHTSSSFINQVTYIPSPCQLITPTHNAYTPKPTNRSQHQTYPIIHPPPTTIPTPRLHLIHSSNLAIRSPLLNPPNLADWFIPIINPNHWEVYKPPLFPENEGKWRFEYKTAFAHLLSQFNEEFVDSFKSITGIVVGSGWNGMYDIMELIDYIERFIKRVKVRPPHNL